MKRSARPLLLMCLPVVFVLAIGLFVSNRREEERQRLVARYSQPFEARLELSRRRVSLIAKAGVSDATAVCVSRGGKGVSRWFIRGRILDVSRKITRELYDYEGNPSRLDQTISSKYFVEHSIDWTNKINFDRRGSSSYQHVELFSESYWQFRIPKTETAPLQFALEAVAVPLEVAKGKLGQEELEVRDATAAQIAAARKLPGAKYFRKALMLNAKDDSKYLLK